MKSLLTITIFLCCLSPAFTQPYAIGKSTPTMVDASRSNRNIPVEIYYPANTAGTNVAVANGVFPVMVIGHGFSMGIDAYYNFRDFYVPKGYIVVLPNTETATLPAPSHPNFGQDLNFAVNYMQSENTNNASLFFGKIKNKTALMGHSMGGGCSFLAAATGNPNITVLLGFAPAETSVSAITAASSISVPALMFYGSKDAVTPPASHVIPMYNNLQSSCKTMVTITDGAHCRFANTNGTCNAGEGFSCIACTFITNAEQHSRTFAIMEPWVDFFLKEQCSRWTAFETALTNTAGTTYVRACNYTLPSATATAQSATSFCIGASVDINGGAAGYNNYLWNNGATTINITATQSGSYTLEVTDLYNCKDTSNEVIVTVGNPSKPALFVPGDNIFCNGESVAVMVSNYNATQTYLWNTSETTDNITVTQTTDVYVKTTDSIGCTIYSDTLSFTMNPNPDTPSVYQSNDTLYANVVNGTYIWYLNGSSLPADSGNFIVPSQNGNYSIAVIDANGCTSQSSDYNYVVSSISRNNISGWAVYPNPVSEVLMLINPHPDNEIVSVAVFDITGRNMKAHFETNGNAVTLRLSGFTAATYFLQVETRTGTNRFTITKAE